MIKFWALITQTGDRGAAADW